MITQVYDSYWYVFKDLGEYHYEAMFEARTKRACIEWAKDKEYVYVIAKGDNIPGSLCISACSTNSINDINKHN